MASAVARYPNSARVTALAIVAVLAALVVGLWVAIAAWTVQAERRALDDARRNTRNYVVAVRGEIGNILRGVEREMLQLSDKIRHSGGAFDLYAWGQEHALRPPGMAQATFVGADGIVISSTIEPRPPPVDVNDREHVRVQIDRIADGLFVGPAVIGRVSGQPVIPVSLRVDDDDGRLLGVLLVSLPPDALITLHRSIDIGRNGVIVLTGLDNRIRARFTAETRDAMVGVGRSLAGDPRPDDFPENAEGSYLRSGVVDGVARVLSYARVGKYPLVITVGLDLGHALSEARLYTLTLIGFGVLASILLAGLGAYLVREIYQRARYSINLAAANDELRVAVRRAEAANEAKSSFLATMSHELRTPLNAIIGFSQLIGIGGSDPQALARHAEYAGYVCTSGERLLALIGDILDAAALEDGRLELDEEIVDLASLIDDCLRKWKPAIERAGLEVAVARPTACPRVRADARRIRQVVDNLLSNAVNFSPDGGRIGVELRAASSGETSFSVSDQGIGMSSEQIDVAQQPFGQAEPVFARQHGGAGLGLSIAKHLIELHGGRITIDSAPGRGTTVRATLPAERSADAPPATDRTAGGTPPTGVPLPALPAFAAPLRA